jgi:hypothetical protein
MSHSTELRSTLVNAIAELESELVALRAALDALDHSGPVVSSRDEQRAARRRSRRAPGVEIVPAGKIEALLAGSDGITTAELARQTDGGHEQILTILKELEQTGRAHRSGTRRSTKWHAGPSSATGTAAATSETAAAASAVATPA